MAQLILIIIGLLAIIKKRIPVTGSTEIRRPKTLILGAWALIVAGLIGMVESYIFFFIMLLSFFILAGVLNEQKQTNPPADIKK